MSLLFKLWRAVKWVVDILGLIQVWRWIEKLLGLGEHIQFIAELAHGAGKLGFVIGYILDPPPWVGLAIVVAAAMLIWLDLRRQSAAGQPIKREARRLGPIILITIGALLILTGVGWYLRDREASHLTAPTASVLPPAPPQTPVPPRPDAAPRASYPQTLGVVCASNLINVAESIWKSLPEGAGILFTAPPENEQLKRNIMSLFSMASQRFPKQFQAGTFKYFLQLPNPDVELDAPKLAMTAQNGITLHWEDPPPNHFLNGFGQHFVLRKTSKEPSALAEYYKVPKLIWIDIGPGDPWKDHRSCLE